MGSAKPSYIESKEPKAKVKKSDTGKEGGQTKAPKGSKESLAGGNKKVKKNKKQSGE